MEAPAETVGTCQMRNTETPRWSWGWTQRLRVVEQERKLNPSLVIIARAHSEDEIEHLKKHGATSVVMGEYEIVKAMIADIPSERTS